MQVKNNNNQSLNKAIDCSSCYVRLWFLKQNVMITHILPINDLEEHEELSTCKCNPEMEVLENGDMMIVHNSFDKREIIERLFED
jgi:hypothetical protein